MALWSLINNVVVHLNHIVAYALLICLGWFAVLMNACDGVVQVLHALHQVLLHAGLLFLNGAAEKLNRSHVLVLSFLRLCHLGEGDAEVGLMTVLVVLVAVGVLDVAEVLHDVVGVLFEDVIQHVGNVGIVLLELCVEDLHEALYLCLALPMPSRRGPNLPQKATCSFEGVLHALAKT